MTDTSDSVQEAPRVLGALVRDNSTQQLFPERYPLWCIDRGPGATESQYQLFGTREDAQIALTEYLEHWPDSRVRRCRRVKASEICFDIEQSVITDGIDLAADDGGLPCHAWGSLAGANVDFLGPSSADATADFARWADEYLVVRAWICEGDE